MIAAVCGWHEQHAAAAAAIEARLDRGDGMVIAAHAVTEAYSVLTRLPSPHRLTPADAWTLLRTNFVDEATVVALPAKAYVAAIDALVADGLAGGRTYDALIAASAAHGDAEELLTFNARHFDSAPDGLRIVEPAAPAAKGKRAR
jgi:predicted nucleic acid-binding protein